MNARLQLLGGLALLINGHTLLAAFNAPPPTRDQIEADHSSVATLGNQMLAEFAADTALDHDLPRTR